MVALCAFINHNEGERFCRFAEVMMSTEKQPPSTGPTPDTLHTFHEDDDSPTSPDSVASMKEGPHRTLDQPSAVRPDVCSGKPVDVVVPGYDILEQLGHGGMGVVYKALHIKSNRLVALKMILSSHHASVHEKVRFQIEAESIASLHHPHIVQLYDIGEHEGQPFFSLEFCDGGSLDKQMKSTAPSSRNAAELVETLARAVHYAHSRGVVHRDLKPANVLLASRGEVTTLKIADFGLAKQLDSASDLSRTGAIIGTPAYMAPEQALGKTSEVGPPADIYALGAILYECLTGRPPFKGESALEVLELVRMREPPAVSRLAPKTPRDLETICQKCLRKSPANRYPTAQDLADDLRRYLNHEPIQARPIGTAERFWRWCRRNPRVAVLLSTLLLVIVAALVSVTVLWRDADAQRLLAEASEADARQQKEIAEVQKRKAEASAIKARNQEAVAEAARARAVASADKASRVSEFLGGIFEAADTIGVSGYGGVIPKATGEKLTALELLNRGAARIDQDTTLSPDTRALIKDRIGNALLSLGEIDRATPLLTEALKLREKHLGPEHPDTVLSLHNVARLTHLRGDYFEGEKLYRQALALWLKMTPLPEAQLADTEFNLGWLLLDMEQYDDSAEMYRRAVDRRVRVFGEKHREVAVARFGLAGAYVEQGDYLKALNEFKFAQEIARKQEGSGKLAEATALFLDAVISSELTKDTATSEKKLLACLELCRKSLPERHAFIAIVLFQLALTQEELKKDVEAEKNYRESIDTAKSQVGLTHPRMAMPMHHLTNLLRRNKRTEEAGKLFDEWIAAHRARPGPFLADALTLSANYFHWTNNETGQRERLQEALALFRKEPATPRRVAYINCLRELGYNRIRAGQYAEAEKLTSDYHSAAVRRYGPKSHAAAIALNQGAVAALSQRKSGPEVEAALMEARSLLRPALPFTAPPPALGDVCINLSALHRLRDQPSQAAPFIREARGAINNVGGLLLVAREYAWCSSDVLRINPKPTADQQAESRRYSDEAMKALEQARSKGLKDVSLLQQQPAFAVLRARLDYQQLLRELQTKKP
jgi:tetratricopeptide (TPR) repeat protein/tRNA A-37 threonylcarbamoyl transferase component Bud32